VNGEQGLNLREIFSESVSTSEVTASLSPLLEVHGKIGRTSQYGDVPYKTGSGSNPKSERSIRTVHYPTIIISEGQAGSEFFLK
jgi:hypothetical protein